jgi:hypothetical protein
VLPSLQPVLKTGESTSKALIFRRKFNFPADVLHIQALCGLSQSLPTARCHTLPRGLLTPCHHPSATLPAPTRTKSLPRPFLFHAELTRPSSAQNRLDPAHFRSSPINFRLPARLSATHSHTVPVLPARCTDTRLLFPKHSLCTVLPSVQVSARFAILLENARYTSRIHLPDLTKFVEQQPDIPPHTPTALLAHYTKQANFSTMPNFSYQLTCAIILDRICSPSQTHGPKRLETSDRSSVNILSPIDLSRSGTPTTKTLAYPPHISQSLERPPLLLVTLQSCFAFTIWWTRLYCLFARGRVTCDPSHSVPPIRCEHM